VLLRPIETPETLGQGKIILIPATREVMTTHQMEVVSVGAPSICTGEDCERPREAHGYEFPNYNETCMSHPCQAVAGDWVLVRHRSLLETHQEGLYCCHQDDVLAILTA